MSVIGRLDEQTDAVLISPLAKKREREEKVAPDSPESATSQTARETDPAKDRSADERRATLPVWLL
jgi:hypothetical protein